VAITAKNGKGKMPPFGTVLTEDQVRDVSVFVTKQLAKK
jgi:mono/diheme cytochrome c family protein